jgi:hypothetical protein
MAFVVKWQVNSTTSVKPLPFLTEKSDELPTTWPVQKVITTRQRAPLHMTPPVVLLSLSE